MKPELNQWPKKLETIDANSQQTKDEKSFRN